MVLDAEPAEDPNCQSGHPDLLEVALQQTLQSDAMAGLVMIVS